MVTEQALELVDVTKRFGARVVLSGLTLRVPRGRMFGFIGLNGSGKTTSLRILLGLLRPEAGQARVLDEPSARIAELSGRVGAALHGTGVDPQLTCRDNLRAHALRHGRRGQDVAPVLARLDLAHVADRRAGQVSQGERQRLTLARALFLEPEVIVLDEPLTHLDPGAVHVALEALRAEVDRRGATVLLSSHQLEHVERSVDGLALIHAGRVVRQGTVDELLESAGRSFRLAVSPGPRALDVLRAMTLVASAEPIADGVGPGGSGGPDDHAASGFTELRVTLHERTPAAVNRALQDAGVAVAELTPERRSLDDVFRTITRDGGAA